MFCTFLFSLFSSFKPTGSFRCLPKTFTTFLRKGLKEEGYFELKRSCARLSYINGKLWCPCNISNGTIDIYTTNGQLFDTMHMDVLKNPHSIHPQTDQHVLIAAENGLYRIHIGQKQISKILEGNFIDVHINNDLIAALEKVSNGKDRVHILDNVDPPGNLRMFTLENNLSQTVLVVRDHRVYVSFNLTAKVSYISEYTITGSRLHLHGQYGHSRCEEFDCPLLCGLDSKQSLLVADTFNNRLQVVSQSNAWEEMHLQGMNTFPTDVVFTKDNQVVMLFSNMTVKKFVACEKEYNFFSLLSFFSSPKKIEDTDNEEDM